MHFSLASTFLSVRSTSLRSNATKVNEIARDRGSSGARDPSSLLFLLVLYMTISPNFGARFDAPILDERDLGTTVAAPRFGCSRRIPTGGLNVCRAVVTVRVITHDWCNS